MQITLSSICAMDPPRSNTPIDAPLLLIKQLFKWISPWWTTIALKRPRFALRQTFFILKFGDVQFKKTSLFPVASSTMSDFGPIP